MLKQLRSQVRLIEPFKNKKGQNTAEYALLIALVIAGVIAMQTYAQRSLQARMRDASTYLTAQTSTIGATNQYEPYYLQSNYDVTRDSVSNKRLDSHTTAFDSATNRVRGVGGSETMTYEGNPVKLGN